MNVLAVLLGPEHHGVVRHGATVASLVAARGAAVTVTRTTDVPCGPHDLTHVQFTDALFGPDVASAAEAFVAWSASVPRPIVVTLHDLPEAGDDTGRGRRRRRAYERVVGACDVVVVSTAAEAGAARALGGREAVVVPLPVEPLPASGTAPPWSGRTTVGVLGFVYPGKGHGDVLDAVGRLALAVAVVAVGSVSPGHGPLLAELRRRAGVLGVELLVTGPLADADLHAAARAVTVPVAAYRTSGASASIATWLACGRRPLVARTPQVEELEGRWPGALEVCEGDLAAAVRATLEDPARTWLDGPGPRPDVGAAHLAVYRAARGPA